MGIRVLRSATGKPLRTADGKLMYRVVSDFFYPEYGLLYNWYAATDARGITSSDDWVVPTYSTGIAIEKVSTLITFLGGSTIAGGKMKETGYTYWLSPNTGATNEVGFNFRGGAIRSDDAGFSQLKNSGKFLTRDLNNAPDNAIVYSISSTSASCNAGQNYSHSAFSVRLVNKSTSLLNGQTGTYTGNDGKIYRTICIGTQEWLADNLAETRFRNGDIIPWHGADPANYFTNAEWAALTTSGCCAHSNTLSNVAAGFTFPT